MDRMQQNNSGKPIPMLNPFDGLFVLVATLFGMRLLKQMVQAGLFPIATVAGLFPDGATPLNIQLVAQMIQALLMAGLTICYLCVVRKGTPADIGFRKPAGYRWIIWSVAAGIGTFILMLMITVAVSRLAPGLVHPQDAETIVAMADTPWGYATVFFMVGVLAPITEEMLFRGYFYHSMEKRCGVIISVILTSLLFGCMHNDLFRVMQLSLIGAYLNSVMLKGNSLWCSILAHSIWNVAMTMAALQI